MDRLEQILMEAYAKIKANQDSSHEAVDPVLAEAMRKYATEVARHNLERAAEQATAYLDVRGWPTPSRESITSLEIELI